MLRLAALDDFRNDEVVDLAVSAHNEADDAPARWPTRN